MAIAKSKELSKAAVEARRAVPKTTATSRGQYLILVGVISVDLASGGLEPNIGAKRGAIDLLT